MKFLLPVLLPILMALANGGQTPPPIPAEYIAYAYHGQLFDRDFKPIELTVDVIDAVQNSMIEEIYKASTPLEKKQMEEWLALINGAKEVEGEYGVVARHAYLDSLLWTAPGHLREAYEWRMPLLRRGLWDFHLDSVHPQLWEFLRRYWPNFVLRPFSTGQQYINACEAEGVPIPPDWPHEDWVLRGTLTRPFISTGLTAQVYTYSPPAETPGACYALPRRDASGSIQLLGIICQSATTGRACFWDNIDEATGRTITGVNPSLVIANLQNGFNLTENCTVCHRGDNAFNIHPGTPLDAGLNTVSPVWYVPIGQATWNNPGPIVMPDVPAGQRSCVACHQLPEVNSSFCRLLRSAVENTMPPGGPYTSWGSPGSSAYATHISFLRSRCP